MALVTSRTGNFFSEQRHYVWSRCHFGHGIYYLSSGRMVRATSSVTYAAVERARNPPGVNAHELICLEFTDFRK